MFAWQLNLYLMIFLLTGMHRSGTSMFARFMHESGINMGEEFYVDESSNKYGHYEDMDFLNVQRQEIAGHFGGEDWLVWEDFEPTEAFTKNATGIYTSKTRSNPHGNWGWKDPRTTLFLDFWHEINPEICYIFMVRRPEAVVNSLSKLLKSRWSVAETAKYLKSYTHYNRAIIRFILAHPKANYVVVSHEILTDNHDVELKKINQKLGTAFSSKLFGSLFDKNVISSKMFIPFIFLRNELAEARQVYDQMWQFFD